MASARVKWLSLGRDSAALFSALLQCEQKARSLFRNVRPSFLLWLRVSRRLLEFALHHHPGFTAGNNVVPLTPNMPQPRRHPGPRLYLILRCEPGNRAKTGGIAFGVARTRPRY